jgi:serine/threonine protein kinase
MSYMETLRADVRAPPIFVHSDAATVLTKLSLGVGGAYDGRVPPPGATARVVPEPTLPRHTQIGPYEILDRLAVGGMAELYLARRVGIEGFQKRVVLKRVLPQLVHDAEFTAMFLNEARLAARLDHPNVVQVLDIGVIDDEFFFVMEYLHGKNLRSVIRELGRGRVLPMDLALNVAIAMAAGLHHAHEARDEQGNPLEIVHRDVSPSNVIVTYDGNVKVIDFGIAKAAAVRADTQTGTLKGKVGYMAPEQFRGKRIDRRTDVFSLAISLYEMTIGHRPFGGENQFAVMNAAVEGEYILPSQAVEGYPVKVEAALARALSANPDDRFASAEEFQVALEEAAVALGISVGPSVVRKFMREHFEVPAHISVDRNPDLEAAARSLSSYRSDPGVGANDLTTHISRSVTLPRRVGWLAGGAMVLTLAGGIGLGSWLSGAEDLPDPAEAAPAPIGAAAPEGAPKVVIEPVPIPVPVLDATAASDEPEPIVVDDEPTADEDTEPEPSKPRRSSRKTSRTKRPKTSSSAKPGSSLFPPSHYD